MKSVRRRENRKGRITVICRELPGSLRMKFTLQGTLLSVVINMRDVSVSQLNKEAALTNMVFVRSRQLLTGKGNKDILFPVIVTLPFSSAEQFQDQ